MALTKDDTLYNSVVLLSILEENFKHVSNQQAFLEACSAFLQEKNISLNLYTGAYTSYIIDCMHKMVVHNKFQLSPARDEFKAIVAGIEKMEQFEREKYKNQPKIIPLLEQLKKNNYVQTGQILADEDMQQAFAMITAPTAVTTPISITADAGSAFRDVLAANKNIPGKLLIPANINNNHWILITRDQDDKNVTITCWDPLATPAKGTSNKTLDIVKQKAEQVYNQAAMSPIKLQKPRYHYAGEQNESFSCGYRVSRQAMIEAGMNNELTSVSADNGKLLCSNFIKTIAQQDPDLAGKELVAVDNGNLALVYFLSGVEGKSSDKIKEVVDNTKHIQLKQDEFLAIALQEVYKDQPNINSDAALKLAHSQIAKLSTVELERKKVELGKWTASHFFKAHPSVSCRKEGQSKEEGDTAMESAHPNINSDAALKLAHSQIAKLSTVELERKKVELGKWTASHFFKAHQSVSCRKEGQSKEEGDTAMESAHHSIPVH